MIFSESNKMHGATIKIMLIICSYNLPTDFSFLQFISHALKSWYGFLRARTETVKKNFFRVSYSLIFLMHDDGFLDEQSGTEVDEEKSDKQLDEVIVVHFIANKSHRE